MARRKFQHQFYVELHALRKKYGQKEYSRDEILPAVKALMVQFVKEGAETFLTDAARTLLDGIEAAEDRRDPNQPDMFHHDAQIALGDQRRICRGRMNIEQLTRRKIVLDDNHARQNLGWAIETSWINARSTGLQGLPLSTVVEDIFNENGTRKDGHAA
jgi:hypothetical protein